MLSMTLGGSWVTSSSTPKQTHRSGWVRAGACRRRTNHITTITMADPWDHKNKEGRCIISQHNTDIWMDILFFCSTLPHTRRLSLSLSTCFPTPPSSPCFLQHEQVRSLISSLLLLLGALQLVRPSCELYAAVMGQFGDTTYTKVFVGGLAWETHQEAMRRYFEQFGEILEAVVIADKHTGRSKGYGFVTFREPDAAMRACVDPAPVIDGRRANCNLAFLGIQRSGPATPKHGVVGRSFRVVKPTFGRQQHQAVGIQGGGPVATPFPSPAATFPHYAFPYSTVYGYGYGYSPYSADYSYPTNYYNVYGGAHYPSAYGGAASGMLTATSEAPLYPYFQLGQPGSSMTSYATGQGYSFQYPQMFHFSTVPSTAAAGTSVAPQDGGPVSLAASPRSQAGRTMALTAPTLSAPAQATAHPYGLVPSHFVVSAAPEHPLA